MPFSALANIPGISVRPGYLLLNAPSDRALQAVTDAFARRGCSLRFVRVGAALGVHVIQDRRPGTLSPTRHFLTNVTPVWFEGRIADSPAVPSLAGYVEASRSFSLRMAAELVTGATYDSGGAHPHPELAIYGGVIDYSVIRALLASYGKKTKLTALIGTCEPATYRRLWLDSDEDARLARVCAQFDGTHRPTPGGADIGEIEVWLFHETLRIVGAA